MLTIKDLADALGLSVHQVRRRIDALNGTIEKHIKRGDRRKIQVDSGGLEMLKRLEALRENGLTIEGAVAEIKGETKSQGSEKEADQSAKFRERPQREDLYEREIERLENQVEYLKNQVEKKDKKLDEKDEQIQKLLPGKVERKGPLTRFFNWLSW